MTVWVYLATMVAGGLASMARYGVTLFFGRYKNMQWGVFVVNVIGSAIGGAVVGMTATGQINPELRLVILGGVAGGLTTFSTWSVETLQLIKDRRWRTALVSVSLNLFVGLAAATSAYLIVTA
ncbi:CrcB family protein [Glaciihabitans sp. dw_435]|uniref:fluoride efflux transporter FluC n=1 Tax=Glaciihabitans sp. dw_435 TaxID=2720081 RepID=UPI001BD3FB1B|nr:CrcB family protein [Glaciihabitans sp. dw_435]